VGNCDTDNEACRFACCERISECRDKFGCCAVRNLDIEDDTSVIRRLDWLGWVIAVARNGIDTLNIKRTSIIPTSQ
jgi:hypothetical protein